LAGGGGATLATVDHDLAKARNGDMGAFAALVTEHQKSVFGLALRMLASAHSAEDIAQDVFMQLHAKLASIESPDHLRFWLRRVTANKAIDQLRRSSLIKVTSLEGEAELLGAEDRGDPLLQKRLQSMLLQLTPAARAVVTLRYQEDLDPVEIARILEMPVNTVKSHLKRSLDSMRHELEDHES
jgi:RNA polymerase sigma-70 factor (ECF subfamily)